MKIIPVILDNYRTLKDKTVKVTFETNELTPEQAQYLHSSLQQFGYLAFKIAQFEKEDLSFLDNLTADKESLEAIGKTKSQQLRAVLYRLWEQDRQGYEDFNLFYEFQMNRIVKHFKDKLE